MVAALATGGVAVTCPVRQMFVDKYFCMYILLICNANRESPTTSAHTKGDH